MGSKRIRATHANILTFCEISATIPADNKATTGTSAYAKKIALRTISSLKSCNSSRELLSRGRSFAKFEFTLRWRHTRTHRCSDSPLELDGPQQRSLYL